jgi:7-cyano-7-deazaguanine synthase in queuosine biosynthesis
MDQGQSTPAVGANLGLSSKAVWQIGKRYLAGGLERQTISCHQRERREKPNMVRHCHLCADRHRQEGTKA